MVYILFAFPLALGAFFLWLARLARRRAKALEPEDVTSTDGWNAFRTGDTRRGLDAYFFGRLPRAWATLATALMVCVIAAVGTAVLLIVVLIASHWAEAAV
jgi:hypothetical protein